MIAATSSGETRWTNSCCSMKSRHSAAHVSGVGLHRTAVAVGIRRVIRAGHERPEALALRHLAGGQRERPHRAAVKRAEERDDVVPLRVVLRQLERRLVRLGARVAEERPVRTRHRRNRRQLLAEPHLRLVVEVGARHVQELLRLVDDRLHDVGMRVAGGGHGNAGRAVEEDVAVHVLDDRALAARDDERIVARVRRRDDLRVALDDAPAPSDPAGSS